MDFMSTVKGSLLDGFYPEGWDMKDWVPAGYNTPELRRTMFDAYMGAADVVAELIEKGVEPARQLVGKLNG